MKSFADTSFLCALYRVQDNSERALAHRARMTGPLIVSRLLLWEFRQTVRFQAFRFSKDRKTGYPLKEAERMIEKITEHLGSGGLHLAEFDMISILARGEQVSKNRTPSGGHRGFDILHIATALEGGASEFLTFDTNQIALAKREGLTTPLRANRNS